MSDFLKFTLLFSAIAITGCLPEVSGTLLRVPGDAIVVIDNFPRTDRVLGECRVLAGRKYIAIHMAEIDRLTDGRLTDAWLVEVLEHEIDHAERTCSDADHAGPGAAGRGLGVSP